MEACKITNLFDVSETIAKDYMESVRYPWELLEGLADYIRKLGERLDPKKYEQFGDDIWIAKNASLAESAYINGPLIIDEEAQIRHCAFIRGSAIVGKGAVVGNSTELKNVILFNKVQVPHYNYVGDSILGYRAHMGAGSITSNVKADKSHVVVKDGDESVDTGRKKVGAMLGDLADIGCNSVLNPGAVIGRNTSVYPLCCVRGVVSPDSIYKDKDHIVRRQ